LDELVREGARRMLQSAIDAEVEAFISQHAGRRDDSGRRLVVKNGNLPAREILTGAGPIEVQQGRVRDNAADPQERVEFTPSVLPAYLRRTDAIEELIPWLYLKGISTSDFGEALQALVGEKATGRSANVVVRLKEQWSDEYDAWNRRHLAAQQYVYVWADGIHAKVRLEDEAKGEAVLPRADGGDARRPERVNCRARRLPRERTELVGVAHGPQAAGARQRAEDRRRGRRLGLLG